MQVAYVINDIKGKGKGIFADGKNWLVLILDTIIIIITSIIITNTNTNTNANSNTNTNTLQIILCCMIIYDMMMYDTQ